MARLSIIIPVLGNPKKLDDTLVSVLENRPAHCEIIVVHNEPYDDPYQLGNEVCFVAAQRGASLSECLKLGVSASRSPFLHVLMCGVEVCAGWANAALQRFHDPDVAAVASALVRRENRSVLVSTGLGYRAEGAVYRMAEGIEWSNAVAQNERPYGPDLLSGFFRKAALESVGAFTSWTSEMFVGADLAMRFRRANFRCAWEPESLAHVDPARISKRSGFACGRDSERFFWRWASDNGWIRSFIGHAALLLGLCVTMFVRPTRIARVAGHAWGFVQIMCRRPSATPDLAPTGPTILPGPHLGDADNYAEMHKPARVA